MTSYSLDSKWLSTTCSEFDLLTTDYLGKARLLCLYPKSKWVVDSLGLTLGLMRGGRTSFWALAYSPSNKGIVYYGYWLAENKVCVFSIKSNLDCSFLSVVTICSSGLMLLLDITPLYCFNTSIIWATSEKSERIWWTVSSLERNLLAVL